MSTQFTRAAHRWDHALCKNILLKLLPNLQHGSLVLQEGDEQWRFGQSEHTGELTGRLEICQPSAWRVLLFGGAIGLAQCYRDGEIECDDLTSLLRLFARNLDWLDQLEARYGWLMAPWYRLKHRLRSNSPKHAKDNIAAHYDLSNEFYRLFLDEHMLYSSALWQAPNIDSKHVSSADPLAAAQQQKMARLCQQLELSEQDHLLEIGTGWGALAIYAAKHYGCRVTTTTISQAQYQEAQARIIEAELEDRIELLCLDYRELTGQYDKIVSVEMIEAVGEAYLPEYFCTLNRLLKPQGKAALQAITIADQRMARYRRGADFIQTYIFPGGFLPSVALISEQLATQTQFVLRDLTDLGLDYAQTLHHWRQRFEASKPQIMALGFDDPFIRLWRFYLCYCQAGFISKRVSAVQITLEKSL